MEDLTIAKGLISVIIGEEIIELEAKPQEQTTFSNKYLLTVFRLDFKAIIKTINSVKRKVLIELQKSNNAFDIMRFRHYLGSNYSNIDKINGIKTVLPIVPIYLLGFDLSIHRPVLKIGRQYQDVTTREIINQKDSFIENLSHDYFVVQIPNLPTETKSESEKILSIFNQKWVFDKDNQWLLKFNPNDDDQDVQRILKRLLMAAESDEVREQIRIEKPSMNQWIELYERKKFSFSKKKQLLNKKK
jgi:hypothetical protein